jgi:hypothetical protein
MTDILINHSSKNRCVFSRDAEFTTSIRIATASMG